MAPNKDRAKKRQSISAARLDTQPLSAVRKTGGGRATYAGTSYQSKVAAWWACYILAEADADPPFDLAADLTFDSLHAETADAVDDLKISTSAKGSIFCQAKHTLALGKKLTTDLGKTVVQFVRQFRSSQPKLDPAKDRLVLVTSSLSSAVITRHLPAFLTRLRTSAAPQEEWTLGNQKENVAAETIRTHVINSWKADCGKSPGLAEIVELLGLVHIQLLDLDHSGVHEHEAKALLRRTVLSERSEAAKAWNTLLAEVTQYATKGQGADRSTLQQALMRDGIGLRSLPSFERDISRLKELTSRALRGLGEFSRIEVGGKAITIERPVAHELEAGAARGHLLVLGLPGAGKSGALYDLGRTLQESKDLLVLIIDQIAAGSLLALREELGLQHDLTSVLAAWFGNGPGYVIIDALDAARSDGAASAVQALISEIISNNNRWHVVASIRKFDLRCNFRLKKHFAGTPPNPGFKDAEFASVRHIQIPAFTQGELAQLQAKSSELGAFVSLAPAPLRELLSLPFNLRLLAELIDAGLKSVDLEPLRTQIDLLDRYWLERVRSNDGQGDARELVLRRVTQGMVAQRSLRVPKDVALQNETSASDPLHALLRSHVLAEWTTETGAVKAEFITFSHHLLFDYACARLFAPSEPAKLVELLTEHPDLLIAIRPSLELHHQRLWHQDPGSFWGVTFGLADSKVHEVGKLLGPSIAALAAAEGSQTQPLVDALTDSSRQDSGVAVLGYILATLLVHRRIDTPWIECLVAASTNLTAGVAYVMRPFLSFASEHVAEVSPSRSNDLGVVSRRLLVFALADPNRHMWLLTCGIRSVAETSLTDPGASIEVLRDCITPDHLRMYGHATLAHLAWRARNLTAADSGFVRDLYVAGFAHHDRSDARTFMNDSLVMSLSSTRQQDYGMGLNLLADYFPDFLHEAPLVAVDALLRVVAKFVEAENPTEEPPAPVRFGDSDTSLIPDYSSVWGQHLAARNDEPMRMLQAFATYIGKVGDESQIREIVAAIAIAKPPALVWRTLLRAGTQSRTTVGRTIRSLGWDRSILSARDTTQVVGNFLTAIFPELTPEERVRVEQAILSLPLGVSPEAVEWAEWNRDRLIGCLDPTLLVTVEGQSHEARLRLAGGPPPNSTEPRFETSFRNLSEVDYLREMGVPVQDTKHQKMLALLGPVRSFANEFINYGPPSERFEAILPSIRALATERLVIQELHPELADRVVIALLQASDSVLRSPAALDRATVDLLQTILLSFVCVLDPNSQATSNGAFASDRVRAEAAKLAPALVSAGASSTQDVRAMILGLSHDTEETVRFELINRLHFLIKTAPDLTWDLLQELALREESGKVLLAAISSLQHVALIEVTRTAKLAEMIFQRVRPDGDEDLVQASCGCCDLFTYLAIRHDDGTSVNVLNRLVAAPMDNHRELQHIVFSLSSFYHDAEAAARSRAFDLTGRILDSYIGTKRALDGDREPDLDQRRKVLEGVDCIARRIHYSSGALDERDVDLPTPNADFFRSSRPVLTVLASMPHPHTSHVVIETLAHFAPLDPGGVLLLIAQSVRASAANNYHFDMLAEPLIVRTIERYLSEFRVHLQQRHTGEALMEILGYFLRAGWTGVHQLACRLGDIHR